MIMIIIITVLIRIKLSNILLRFYFHDVLEELKTNFPENFRFESVLGFVIEDAWISKLFGDAALTLINFLSFPEYF